MRREASFWRNVGLIGLLHVAAVIGLTRWSGRTEKTAPSEIRWLEGGPASESGPKPVPVVGAPESEPSASPIEIASTPPDPIPDPVKEEAPSSMPAAESELRLASPTPTATPKPTPAPTPSPRAKASPSPTPKKKIRAKTSPTPSPKPRKVTAKKSSESSAKKVVIKADAPEKQSPRISDSPAAAAPASSNTAGTGGRGSGAGGASQFGWYASMLHDRFFSEWVQPTTNVPTGSKMSALVRIRIEKDGRVSNFEIVRPSGNVVVDESVAAVAKRVTQVDALPPGLGMGGHYDVKINFELD